MSRSIKYTKEERDSLAHAALTMTDENILKFCSESPNKQYCDSTPLIAERVESAKAASRTGRSPHSKSESIKVLSQFKPEELVDYAAPLDDEGFKEFYSTSPKAEEVIRSNKFLEIRAESLGLSREVPLANVMLTGNVDVDAKTLAKYPIDELEEYAESDPLIDRVLVSPQFASARSSPSGKVGAGFQGRVSKSPAALRSRSASPTRAPLRAATSPVRSPSPVRSVASPVRSQSRSPSPVRSLAKSPSPVRSPVRSSYQTGRDNVSVSPLPATTKTSLIKSNTYKAGDVVVSSSGATYRSTGYKSVGGSASPSSRTVSAGSRVHNNLVGEVVQDMRGNEFVASPASVSSHKRSPSAFVRDESSSSEEDIVHTTCSNKGVKKPSVHWR